MESYRSEDEQVEALRRWWDENGRSTIVAIVVALAAGFGWQGWQARQESQRETASDLYQAMLRELGPGAAGGATGASSELAAQLMQHYSSSTYAQFAALHLAAAAVNDGDLAEAEAQLRWTLGKAEPGSDTARVAQLRLARVMASSGNTEQALSVLAGAEVGAYAASYAAARGDILLAAGRDDEARAAYEQALMLASAASGGAGLPALQQKLQSLTPVPPQQIDGSVTAPVMPGVLSTEAAEPAENPGE